MMKLTDYLKEQLYEDLCITFTEINEAGGLYDGQIELANKIVNDMYASKQDTTLKYDHSLKYDHLDFKNVFFNELIVNVHFWNLSSYRNQTKVSSYIEFNDNPERYDFSEKYNYDVKTNRFRTVVININCPQSNLYEEDVRARIIHELNHGYAYWEILKNDFSEKNVPDEYDSQLHKWNDKIYKKLAHSILNPTNDEAKQVCYNFIYTLTRYERNAFLAEIVSYLFDKNCFKNAADVNSALEKSHQYKLYTDEGPRVLNAIKTKWSDEMKSKLAEAYNVIYNKNYTYAKVIKLLEFKLAETIKKINRNINVLCRKYRNGGLMKSNIVESNISFEYFPEAVHWF